MTAQLVYLTQHHSVEELCDVTTDPYEFDNLAFSPERCRILEEMRYRCPTLDGAHHYDEVRRQHAS